MVKGKKLTQKDKEPWEMTRNEYEKEYFKPNSKFNDDAQDVWRTWQKQKLMGQRKDLPYGITSFKQLIKKTVKDYHKYEVQQSTGVK